MPRNVFSGPSSYRIAEHIIMFSSLQVAFTSATSEVLQSISMVGRMPQEYSIIDSKWLTLYYEKSESTAGLESLKWTATTGDLREVSEGWQKSHLALIRAILWLLQTAVCAENASICQL